MKVVEVADLDLNVANNIILFRLNGESWQREMRIVKMEGTGHPLEWMTFKITSEGIELL